MRAFILTALVALSVGCSPAPKQAPPAQAPKPAAAPAPPSTTYLASISVPLGPDERLTAFSFDTWGVRVLAVCQIPPGWTITGGGSAAPEGVIAGEGSHGVTWIGDMKSLESLVLIRLDGPVQEIEEREGATIHPATFKGTATLATRDDERKLEIGHANVRLVPASRCP